MKVFIVGGTGLLGSAGARELIARGHEVVAMALRPAPDGADLPPQMQVEVADFMELDDDALRDRLRGCEGLVFAAGVDERIEAPPPIYDLFARHNITALSRLLRLARESGVKHAVVCGSYFTHFERIWPEKQLTRWHPYIRSRVDQEAMALSFASDDFDVAVLELPYIFGAQRGRRPVWVFFVEQVRALRWATACPRGGSAMVTVRQVGEAMAGALERNRGGTAYPIGWFNLTFAELFSIIHKHLGIPGKRIVTLPKPLSSLVLRRTSAQQRKRGHEGGLDLLRFADVLCAEAFIDRSLGSDQLGVGEDDLDAAIAESVRLSNEILDGTATAVGMMVG
ncbi:MAG: NAD(P)H-binding protein [Propionibacteriaceae bacterium]|nr:NAD(P)H-binding protein [Propionibacteriaceae bacterium]